MTTFLAILLIIVSALMVLVVLVQRGRGGGLSGAFGAGGGGSSSAFGTKTGDVFTTITVVLFVAFLLIVIWLNFRFQPGNGILGESPKPAPTTAVAPIDNTPIDPALLNTKGIENPATSIPASQPK